MEAIAKVLPILGAGAGGAGLIGNILSSMQQGRVASEAEHNAHLTPAQLGTMVSGATAPLDRNLINTVNNQVQADMAQRGLAEAPGIFGATEAGAIAPFEQANQDRALQLILAKLGLPASTLMALRSGGGGNANLSPLLQMIMKNFPGKTTPGPTPPIVQSTTSPGLTPTDNGGGLFG